MPDRIKQVIKIKYGAVSGSGSASFALDTNPIFKQEDVEGNSVAQICWQLREWKVVHTTVQRLLDSTYSMRLRYESKYQLTEDLAGEIEREWYYSCESKAEDLLKAIDSFQHINHIKFDELKSVMTANPNVRQYIRELDSSNTQSFRVLKLSIVTLNSILVDILTVTDLYIIRLIDLLKPDQEK